MKININTEIIVGKGKIKQIKDLTLSELRNALISEMKMQLKIDTKLTKAIRLLEEIAP